MLGMTISSSTTAVADTATPGAPRIPNLYIDMRLSHKRVDEIMFDWHQGNDIEAGVDAWNASRLVRILSKLIGADTIITMFREK